MKNNEIFLMHFILEKHRKNLRNAHPRVFWIMPFDIKFLVKFGIFYSSLNAYDVQNVESINAESKTNLELRYLTQMNTCKRKKCTNKYCMKLNCKF